MKNRWVQITLLGVVVISLLATGTVLAEQQLIWSQPCAGSVDTIPTYGPNQEILGYGVNCFAFEATQTPTDTPESTPAFTPTATEAPTNTPTDPPTATEFPNQHAH